MATIKQIPRVIEAEVISVETRPSRRAPPPPRSRTAAGTALRVVDRSRRERKSPAGAAKANVGSCPACGEKNVELGEARVGVVKVEVCTLCVATAQRGLKFAKFLVSLFG